MLKKRILRLERHVEGHPGNLFILNFGGPNYIGLKCPYSDFRIRKLEGESFKDLCKRARESYVVRPGYTGILREWMEDEL